MKNRGIVFKLVSCILVTSIIFFLIVSNHNAKKIRSIFQGNLRVSAENLSYSTLNKIESIIKAVEKIPQQMALSLNDSNYSKEDLLLLLRKTVESNPELYGSAIAFEPYMFDAEALYFAPYFYKDKNDIKSTYIGSESYKYFSWDWYKIPKEKNKPMWSEPYFDEGAGNIVMATYSVPFYRSDKEGRKLMGIVTADISLKWLQEMVSSIKIAETGYAFLISKKGTLITHPKQNLILNHTIFSLANEFNRPDLYKLGEEMVKGETNFVSIKHLFTGEDAWLFYAPLPSNGWSLGVVFPKSELLAGITRLQIDLRMFAAAGMILLIVVIIFIARSITKPIRKLSIAAEEMAKGNMDVIIPDIKSNDEVGKLARSFDYMERSLKLHIQQIEYISKLPGENPNPVFRVGKNGQVLYANLAATKNLKDWGLKVGGTLPADFGDLAKDSMLSGGNKILEIKHNGRVFNFELMPVAESGYINIYGKDITEKKLAEEKLEKITAEKNHMENEVKMATLVQEGFLPEAPPVIKGYQFAAKTLPAKFVGGDFFDFISLNENSLGMVLGDVSGKGVSAALYMAKLMSDFRYVSFIHSDPGDVISQINYILANRARKGMFATAVFLILDIQNKKLNLCNAGHHSLIILRNKNQFHEVGKAGGIPLGINKDAPYTKEEVVLQSGDIVVLYSDGALEPVNKQNEQYGMDRLQATLLQSINDAPKNILENLESSIKTFTENATPFDDMTFLIFKVE
ncbi:MAG: SpoIIE family protein phosphatase [Nitrospina sp.]|jgi:serine phosphatase RsbU (regulator of sigma subunit)/HAMP domain-containing protein|nr:SpoIIE family protein phosphatase [Nitrospina sp.]